MPYGYTGQNLINQTVKNSGVFSISDVADLEKQGKFGGSLELIEEQTASGDSSVDFINLANNPFDVYMVQILNLTTSATSQSYVRVSNDNGSTFHSGSSDYKHALQNLTSTGTKIENKSATKAQINLSMYSSTATGSSSNGYIYLYNLLDADVYSSLTTHSISLFSDKRMSYGGGHYATAEVNNAFQIKPSAGTISGSFTLFGVKEL